jgi:hypothetical protein
MTRHESRRPIPNTTGPSVPEANLRTSQNIIPGLPAQLMGRAHARQDVHIRRQPHKEYFKEMRVCPVLDVDGANTYQVAGARVGFAIWRRTLESTKFLDRNTIRTPLLHSPGRELFRKETTPVGGRPNPGRRYCTLERIIFIRALRWAPHHDLGRVFHTAVDLTVDGGVEIRGPKEAGVREIQEVSQEERVICIPGAER